jgi:ATP-dependent helicase HrpB
VRHWFDASQGTVKASRVVLWDALVVSEYPCPPDPEARARILAEEWLRRPMPDRDLQWLQRISFVGAEADVPVLVQQAATEAAALDDIDLEAATPWALRQRVTAGAPDAVPLPSGRTARLDYRADGSVHAAVKLQELFGLADTPRLGPRRVPVTFALLAPNGRPVQTTSDLRSFWSTTYAEVRKELRGRYPRHPWPDDPWTATPTHRTSPRR